MAGEAFVGVVWCWPFGQRNWSIPEHGFLEGCAHNLHDSRNSVCNATSVKAKISLENQVLYLRSPWVSCQSVWKACWTSLVALLVQDGTEQWMCHCLATGKKRNSDTTLKENLNTAPCSQGLSLLQHQYLYTPNCVSPWRFFVWRNKERKRALWAGKDVSNHPLKVEGNFQTKGHKETIWAPTWSCDLHNYCLCVTMLCKHVDCTAHKWAPVDVIIVNSRLESYQRKSDLDHYFRWHTISTFADALLSLNGHVCSLFFLPSGAAKQKTSHRAFLLDILIL